MRNSVGALVERRQLVLADLAEQPDAVVEPELLGALPELERRALPVADADQRRVAGRSRTGRA